MPASDQYVAGYESWERGEFQQAFEIFLELVEQGDPNAMNHLGICYESGLVGPIDTVRAEYWYKRAYRQDRQGPASSNLADLYWKAGDRRRAFAWIDKSIARGDGDSLLDKAKWLLAARQKPRVDIAIDLLRRARRSKYITPAGHDEAGVLLKRLVDANSR